MSDAIKDAQEAIIRAIADLRAANLPVPISLHRAAHALSYAMAERQGRWARNTAGAAFGAPFFIAEPLVRRLVELGLKK
jgi:hypothetical protein